jgi:hypothetical protein
MKPWMIALIASAVFLVGAAAITGTGPPAAAAALVGGSVLCSEFGGQANLTLAVGSVFGPSGPGGVIGIPAVSRGFEPSFQLAESTPGACVDALAALGTLLPSPLCASTHFADGVTGFGFVCSGLAREVVEAVGNLAKALFALP